MGSISEEELSEICVGSFMIWFNPNYDVTFSNAFPREVVLSLEFQNFDFALKLPITTKSNGFFPDKLRFNKCFKIVL